MKPAAAGLLLLVGCGGAPAGGIHRATRVLMGTTFEVAAYAPSARGAEAEAALEEALDEVARLESLLSVYDPQSEISRVNAAAGGQPVRVSPEVLALVQRSLEWCARTDGRLDVTFLPLGRAWDYRQEPFVTPAPEAVAAARALVDCGAVEVDPEGGTLRLPRAGMGLGLGALAKGTAVDRVGDLLVERGFPDNLVNGGGDVRARGTRGDGPWQVGVQHPRAARGDLMARVPLVDAALVTSGDYERFTEDPAGRRIGHVVDPRTGRPVEGVVSVSVLAPSAETADALATALFVAGPEGARDLLARFPGADALVVSSDGTWWASPGLAGLLGQAP